MYWQIFCTIAMTCAWHGGWFCGLEWKQAKIMLLQNHIHGLVQACSTSNALAMDILKSCTKPSKHSSLLSVKFSGNKRFSKRLYGNPNSHTANIRSHLENPIKYNHREHLIFPHQKDIRFFFSQISSNFTAPRLFISPLLLTMTLQYHILNVSNRVKSLQVSHLSRCDICK